MHPIELNRDGGPRSIEIDQMSRSSAPAPTTCVAGRRHPTCCLLTGECGRRRWRDPLPAPVLLQSIIKAGKPWLRVALGPLIDRRDRGVVPGWRVLSLSRRESVVGGGGGGAPHTQPPPPSKSREREEHASAPTTSSTLPQRRRCHKCIAAMRTLIDRCKRPTNPVSQSPSSLPSASRQSARGGAIDPRWGSRTSAFSGKRGGGDTPCTCAQRGPLS